MPTPRAKKYSDDRSYWKVIRFAGGDPDLTATVLSYVPNPPGAPKGQLWTRATYEAMDLARSGTFEYHDGRYWVGQVSYDGNMHGAALAALGR